jgi:2-polyprenyl-3-methyl-5-hydroxy-6-metoxy-1,4-benzoquinol methylase
VFEFDLVTLFGWRALLLHGDPPVWDRWRWLKRHLRQGSVRTLDAGCGNGVFSFYAASVGNQVIGLTTQRSERERAEVRAKRLGEHRIQFCLTDLRALADRKADLGTFDQVICLETLEHIVSDARVLTELASMLNPGGTLLLTSPSVSHHALYGEEREPTLEEDGSHVRYGYSLPHLRQMVEAAGLAVTHEAYVSGVISQTLTSITSRLSEHVGARLAWLLTLPLRPLVSADRRLTDRLGRPYLSLAVCGELRTGAPHA